MAIKLNERTLALLAARSVPNQLTYLAMTVKLNEMLFLLSFIAIANLVY